MRVGGSTLVARIIFGVDSEAGFIHICQDTHKSSDNVKPEHNTKQTCLPCLAGRLPSSFACFLNALGKVRTHSKPYTQDLMTDAFQ